MNIAIRAAIRMRAVLQFCYEGGTRMVEPYCHGTSTAGHEVLRGFQTGGYSYPGSSPVGWRLFDVTKITSLRQTGDQFWCNRDGYTPHDREMKSVHCHV